MELETGDSRKKTMARAKPALTVLPYAAPRKLNQVELFRRAFSVAFRFSSAVFIIGGAASEIIAILFFPNDRGDMIWLLLALWLAAALYCLAVGCFACWIRVCLSQSDLRTRNAWRLALIYTSGVLVGMALGNASESEAVGLLVMAWLVLGPIAIGLLLVRQPDIMDRPLVPEPPSRFL